MFELFQMWALVELLGLVCFPLTLAVCHNLPDRGWAFSKSLGVAVFGFCIWFPLMLIPALPFSQFFILGVGLLLLAASLMSLLRVRFTVLKVVRSHLPYVVVTELIFLGMVFLLGWLRSCGPEIRSYEMFMDEGFIAGIMRSPHLPPNDVWFAGYSINYYYYAHFIVAMLAKLLGQSPSVAFNTGISLFFGLTAVNLFGVTANIVGWGRYLRRCKRGGVEPERADYVLPSLSLAIPFGLLTMVMGLIFGNLAATQQWWQQHGDAMAHFDWFAPSRVIPSTINEFPAFSFLLSCFHAHVLALAFTILAIGLACNLLLEKDGKGLALFGRGWHLPINLLLTALVLGGLFTMNGWDYPVYLALAVTCIGLQQWLAYECRFQWSLVFDIFFPVVCLGILSFLLYTPFYLHFSSPAQGLGLLPATQRSLLGNELQIYGLFAFIFLSLLLASIFKRPLFELFGVAGQDAPAVIASATLPESIASEEPVDTFPGSLQMQAEMVGEPMALEQAQDNMLPGQAQVAVLVAEQEVVPETYPASWMIWLLGVVTYLVLCLALLRFLPNSLTLVVGSSIALIGTVALFYNLRDRTLAFVLLLGSLAFALVAFCEIVFLRDAFAGGDFQRMNTVFKFYFQAWALLSIACGGGLFFILDSFRPEPFHGLQFRWMQRGALGIWSLFLLVLFLASATYPLVAPYWRYGQSDPKTQKLALLSTNSLDGLTYLGKDPAGVGDYQAIRWLNEHIQGDPVIVEAVGDDYSSYARISAFTGLPTPMGWVGHEIQWRLNWLNNPTNGGEFNRRGGDVSLIYTNPNNAQVLTTMAHYHAQYLYVGLLEREKYTGADLQRFRTFMNVVYNANGVTIYQVR
ncbi:DUF2298 domain-containing protein [Tengunoibacter tsumagoiensis]|uniref:YYY membrane protein n=1 Tax=Tengunoibacter tsumagoiensis TaxID=2014871 RepID=A0A401ZXV2_9CHLR|nr:DUF2298 domain-containing protein [Tengunoibacter tsumagoiensis]GCE11686.1 hypothetical protein KTT_15450 [Tengunoibacter tsumagoiensis]